MAAVPKLTGNPAAVQGFAALGLGQWFRLLTGTLEVVGAIGLLIPALYGLAALLLAAVMVGAVATHLFVLGGSPLPALVLLVINAGMAWNGRDQIARLFTRP